MDRVGATPKSAAGRTACINIRELPLQLLLRRHPEWQRRPVAVVEKENPRAPSSGRTQRPAGRHPHGNAICLRPLTGPEPVRGNGFREGNPGRGEAGPPASGPFQPPDRALRRRTRDFLGRCQRTGQAPYLSRRLGRTDRLPSLPAGAEGPVSSSASAVSAAMPSPNRQAG